MKIVLFYLMLVLCIVCCRNDGTLSFETYALQSDTCHGCPEVTITIPDAMGNSRIARSIDRELREEIIAMLTFEEEGRTGTLENAIASFRKGYSDLKKLYPDEVPGWKAELFGEISYEDEHMITLQLNSYIYTGGAHGYGSTKFLNFDKQKGRALEDWELFQNQKDFQRFAEARFRKQEKIPEGKPINSTGFMFESDSFYLPENMGFTAKGLKLLYNQYEVASYADGPVELVLPHKEVRKYLNSKIKS